MTTLILVLLAAISVGNAIFLGRHIKNTKRLHLEVINQIRAFRHEALHNVEKNKFHIKTSTVADDIAKQWEDYAHKHTKGRKKK
jgi:hypothetical protein